MSRRLRIRTFIGSKVFESEFVGLLRLGCSVTRERVSVRVSRCDVTLGGSNADSGLLEIFVPEADGIQHGAGGGAFRSVHEDTGIRAQRILFDWTTIISKKGQRSKKPENRPR